MKITFESNYKLFQAQVIVFDEFFSQDDLILMGNKHLYFLQFLFLFIFILPVPELLAWQRYV